MSGVETAGSIRWATEARKGRRRLFRVTFVYSSLATAAAVHALQTDAGVAAVSWLLGAAGWTWVEYLVHRYVLHGTFPDGPGLRHWTHRLFDHLHVEHHLRPWDGNHINGTLKDTAPFLAPAAALALLLPPPTLLAFLAGFVQAYVLEEWIHHSVHYYHFDNVYFRHVKRHHLYHHSQAGQAMAFGLSSPAWDVAYGTRIPGPVRAALYGPPALGTRETGATRATREARETRERRA